ncbi:hypothetical protein [Rhodococcus marinonascens]|uniref:hypothetical protein n=1 Tax=Rhodococcus marinonascens TaxID=38311 RepID=UPI000A02551D|nr:hypothetical protein [Rhodococcus marinonascens]
MPIYVHVDADPASCIECATALRQLADTADRGARGFRDARNQSEDDWTYTAGDNFRATVDKLAKSSEEVADRANDIAAALRAFADDMNTVKKRMTQAAARAMEGGLRVGPDVRFPTWIADPDALQPVGPWSIEQLTMSAQQNAAYGEALSMLATAREIERLAHEDLRRAFGDSTDRLDRLKGSAPWMLAGGALSYVGTAVQEANKWGEIARTQATQLQNFRNLAVETGCGPAATKAVNAFAPAADDAARFAAQNSRLIGGQTGGVVGKFLSDSVASKNVSKLGSKIPGAGVVFASAQIAYDLQGAEDAGDVAVVVA